MQCVAFYSNMAAIGGNIALGALTPTAESNIAKLENVLVNHANDLTEHEKKFVRAMLQRLGGVSKIILESEYKTHYLSKLVYQARKEANNFKYNNYAVYEYLDLKGKLLM
jgi:hypothetical protein